VAQSESTCWTVIHAAAAGDPGERAEFARRYGPVIRTYLAARWRSSPCRQDLDDAVQELFVECFKPAGVLARAEQGRGDFRPFLFGVVRNVALRLERLRGRDTPSADPLDLDAVADDGPSASRAFERAWATALFREAGRLQEQRAAERGEAACRRVELLRLRFQDGLPIREIARRWGTDTAGLHHEYAKARREFKAALVEVVAFHHPGTTAEVEQECANLLTSLG
jgi:RNA polymerase sigma-70 factor (ECF subfamily)